MQKQQSKTMKKGHKIILAIAAVLLVGGVVVSMVIKTKQKKVTELNNAKKLATASPVALLTSGNPNMVPETPVKSGTSAAPTGSRSIMNLLPSQLSNVFKGKVNI